MHNRSVKQTWLFEGACDVFDPGVCTLKTRKSDGFLFVATDSVGRLSIKQRAITTREAQVFESRTFFTAMLI